jgi:hypothetical protein
MLVAVALLASACRERASRYQVEPEQDDRPGPRIVSVPYTAAKLPAPPAPPLDYATVRRDVEAEAQWTVPLRGVCPREIIDRSEERRLYPLIDVMHGLGYATVTAGEAHGQYVQTVALTADGWQALGAQLAEEAERYVVTLAHRELVGGSERWSWRPNRDDGFTVDFDWRWKPLNEVGKRLTLGAPGSFREELPGRATYQRTADGWRVDAVWLSNDTRDYMWKVTR